MRESEKHKIFFFSSSTGSRPPTPIQQTSQLNDTREPSVTSSQLHDGTTAPNVEAIRETSIDGGMNSLALIDFCFVFTSIF